MANKTPNIGLTLFERGDRPDNELFNENNLLIDTALHEASTHTHNGINSAKIQATDVKFSNYDTGLSATNIEDAVKEVFHVANRKIDWIVNSIGKTTDGFNNPDRRVNEIEDDFSKARTKVINSLNNAPLFSTNKLDSTSSIDDVTEAINNLKFKDATATKEDFISTSKMYTKYGVAEQGAMPSNGETTVYPTGYMDVVIPKGGYTSLILKGFGVEDPAAYIKKGKTIFGVTGRLESDNPTGWNVGDSIAKEKLTTTNTNTCFIKKMSDTKAGFYSSYQAINIFNREWKHFKVDVVSGKLNFTFYSEDFTGQISQTVSNTSGIEEIYSNPYTNESSIMHRRGYLIYNDSFWGERRPEYFFILCRKNSKDCILAIWYDSLNSTFECFGEITIASKYVIQGFVYDKNEYNDFNNNFMAFGYNKETDRDVDLKLFVEDNYNSSDSTFKPTLANTTPIDRGVGDNYIKKSTDDYLLFDGGTLTADGIQFNKDEFVEIKGFTKYYQNVYFEFFNNFSSSSQVKVTLYTKTGNTSYTYDTTKSGGAEYWSINIWNAITSMKVECTQGSIIVGGISETDATSDNMLFTEEWGFMGEDVMRLPIGRNKFIYAYPNTASNYSYKCYTNLVYNNKVTHVADLYVGRDIKLNDYNFNTFRMRANGGYIYSTYYDTRNYTEGNYIGRVYTNVRKIFRYDINSSNDLTVVSNGSSVSNFKPFVPMYISSTGKVVGIERSLTPQKYAYLCSMDISTCITSNVMGEWSETEKRTHIEELRVSDDGNTRNALRMFTGVTECYRGQQVVPNMLLGNIIYSKTSNSSKTYSIIEGIREINSDYNVQHGFLSLYNKMFNINSTRQ